MAEYLKLPEVARRLDVSEKTARRYVKSGALPSVFIGGAYRVSEADLNGFLEGARVEPGKAEAPPSLEPTFNDVLEEERRTKEEWAPLTLMEQISKHGERLEQALKESDDIPLGEAELFLSGYPAVRVMVETVVPPEHESERVRKAKQRLDTVSSRLEPLFNQFFERLNPAQRQGLQRFRARRRQDDSDERRAANPAEGTGA